MIIDMGGTVILGIGIGFIVLAVILLVVRRNTVDFYFRGQRARRTCLHVHLEIVARLEYPAAYCGIFVMGQRGRSEYG